MAEHSILMACQVREEERGGPYKLHGAIRVLSHRVMPI